MWRSENNFQGWVLSSPSTVGSEVWTLVIRLVWQALLPAKPQSHSLSTLRCVKRIGTLRQVAVRWSCELQNEHNLLSVCTSPPGSILRRGHETAHSHQIPWNRKHFKRTSNPMALCWPCTLHIHDNVFNGSSISSKVFAKFLEKWSVWVQFPEQSQ